MRREEFFFDCEREMSKEGGHPGREVIGEMRRRYIEEHRRDRESEGEVSPKSEMPKF